MPEYLAPGVHVEEVSVRRKPIEGVATSVTGFVGPTRKGPVDEPTIVTSFGDFERVFGSLDDIRFSDGSRTVNYLAHAARAFFDNGGKRLYVARALGTDSRRRGRLASSSRIGARLGLGRLMRPPRATAADYASALDRLAAIEDIALVAAPGYSSLDPSTRTAIEDALIAHADAAGAYRFAVLDAPPRQTVPDIMARRSRIDDANAALYYPWVIVARPPAASGRRRSPRELSLPPSGFVCGIYARTDAARGVWKAPANEVVRGASRFERDVTVAEQDVLNPAGVNCLRSIPSHGLVVWGARTVSSDTEWKYVNVRRLFLFLEHSIDQSTRWAVFEPNDQPLWDNVVRSIDAFLETQWRNGALQGAKPEDAYFVRCDRSTMTESDIANGRLVCLVGVALVEPAEFVIFRIGQKTADAGG